MIDHLPEDPVRHVIEKGDDGQEALSALAKIEGIGITVEPNQDPKTGRFLVPFQAADLIAYEHRPFVRLTLEDNPRPPVNRTLHYGNSLFKRKRSTALAWS